MPLSSSSQSRYTESRIAASCLIHPWSLFALFALACNDHWYKGLGPVWLTGKLSDFAGLFYFPFLVILLIAQFPALRHSRLELPLGRFVFWAVGIWFAATKTIPIVHAATVHFAEAFVGEVQIVLDPSDAYATIVLIPAWQLYKYVATVSSLRLGKRIQPIVIVTAVLLTVRVDRF